MLGKIVFFWAGEIPIMVSAKAYGGNVLGGNEGGIIEVGGHFGPGWKRISIGMAISHVGDLLVS